ncbi:MAG: hypothetical protein RID07_15245, partial [Lacipirellulaceae bacterium]
GLAGWLPPPSPQLSSQEVAAIFQASPGTLLVAMFLLMTSMGMIGPWGVAIASLLRPVEQGIPYLTYMQLVNCSLATLVVLICPLFWAAAAFRPFDLPADILRLLNDIAWFFFLAPWPPFTCWLIALAAAILQDKRLQPVFPRWTAFLCLWSALLFVPAGLIMIFKAGPFAWDGLIAFYIPVGIFFIWLLSLSFYAIKSVLEGRHLTEIASAGAA